MTGGNSRSTPVKNAGAGERRRSHTGARPFSHNWGERTVRSVAPQEREHLRGPLARLLEGRPVSAVVEKYQARVGDVVEDRDADLERHHPVVAPVDEEDGRLDAGEVLCVVARQADRLAARLDEL